MVATMKDKKPNTPTRSTTKTSTKTTTKTTRKTSTKTTENAIGKKNKELGRKGEEAAARFLYKRGYEILERNWSCYAGEADIIAQDEGALVFVEVKTRRDCQKGFPAEAVSSEKRDKYEKIALAYLSDADLTDMPVRFDVVSIVVVARNRAMIRHHINAFSVVAK